MPRKEGEGAPMHDAGKMSEETRKKVFENEEVRTKRGTAEGPHEGRHYSGASESGSGNTGGGPRDGG